MAKKAQKSVDTSLLAILRSLPPDKKAEQVKKLRYKSQTDLWFFLTQILFPRRKFSEKVHRPMCELFVKKNPDIPIDTEHPENLDKLDPIKQRLLLAPRNSFKTTIDVADIIQWIITYPNIAILILSGAESLAVKIVHEVRAQFISNELLRELFPEYCLAEDDKVEKETYRHEARTEIIKEPTIETSTVRSVKASSHYHVIKGDDVIHEINSRTIEQIKQAQEAIEATSYLLNPGGYFDFVGTRYHAQDAYGRLIELKEKAEADGDAPETKTLILPAWVIKEGRELKNNPDTGWPIVKEDDVEILFPERLSFKELIKRYRRDPYQFSCQQLQNPHVRQEKRFDLDTLKAHAIPHTQLPEAYTTYIQWDLAGPSKRKHNDRCVGVAGRINDKGQLFVVDIVAGRWDSYQQAAMIVEFAQQHRPQTIFIEDAQGARHLEPTIVPIALKLNVQVPIKWLPASRAHGAKFWRISTLEASIRDDRVFFLGSLPILEDAFSELVDWPHGTHDDIPDALAQMVRNTLNMDVGSTTPQQTNPDTAKLMWNMLFGNTGVMAPTQEQTESFHDCGPLGYGLNGGA